MRRLTICIVLAALGPAGCGEPAKPGLSAEPPKPVEMVDSVQLSASPPNALNWDDSPGLDGIQVVVQFYQMSQDLPVTVSGTLDFLLCEGMVGAADLAKAQVFHMWTYQAYDLPQYLFRSFGLWGYSMRLGWGAHLPTTDTVTLTARYQPPGGGQPIYARPIIIMMTEK